MLPYNPPSNLVLTYSEYNNIKFYTEAIKNFIRYGRSLFGKHYCQEFDSFKYIDILSWNLWGTIQIRNCTGQDPLYYFKFKDFDILQRFNPNTECVNFIKVKTVKGYWLYEDFLS